MRVLRFSFDLLTVLLNAGAHFVIRLKEGVEYRIIRSNPIPDVRFQQAFAPSNPIRR